MTPTGNVAPFHDSTPARFALAIHDDIGALLALAIALRHCRINLIPATTVPEALHLLTSGDRPPDILIVNGAIEGSFALAKTLCEQHSTLKAIGIVSDTHGSVRNEDFLAATFAASQCSIPRWVSAICSLG